MSKENLSPPSPRDEGSAASGLSEARETPQKAPIYFASIPGVIALLTLLLPFVPILPEISLKTQVMSFVVCALILMGTYMERRALWERELRISVRGAKSRSSRLLAFGALIISMGLWFFLVSDGANYVKQLLPGPLTEKFIIRPLQLCAFAGLALAFSIMAALGYMSKLDRAKPDERPPHLQPEKDLPDLAAGVLRANLQIPAGVTWKIVERERTPSGGVKFVMSWTEEIEKTTSKGESVKFVQERKYLVNLDVRGRIISFKEQTG